MRVRLVRKRINFSQNTEILVWSIIGVGIILRLVPYLTNRSLWLDEARLALNITNRSFEQFLQPLDYEQGAPVGFLMVEKLVTQIFGNNEFALRLFPLLAGVISLFLFYKVASHCLIKEKSILVACAFFTLSSPLIYYASEVKQYSSDVAIGLLLYLITFKIQSKKSSLLHLVFLGGVGVVALWLSHPALFILISIGIILALCTVKKKEWIGITRLFLVYLLWGLNFIVLYFFMLRNLSTNTGLLDYWTDSFMPLPPSSFEDVKWFINTFFQIFKNPVGLTVTDLAAFTFLLGAVAMFRTQKESFLLLILPILLALLASGFHKYPFDGRLLLFIVPTVVIIITEGLAYVKRSTHPNSVIITATLTGLLFLHPTLSATHDLIKPNFKEEIKPVINYVKIHQQLGDVLYLYYGAQDAFKYYQARYGYQDDDYIIGVHDKDDWQKYADDLKNLQAHKRVWVLFSHIYNWENVDEERLFVYFLDRMGSRVDVFQSEGASVYLYDLSQLK